MVSTQSIRANIRTTCRVEFRKLVRAFRLKTCRNTSSFHQQDKHESGASMQRSLHRDIDLDTKISVCKTPVVDEKMLILTIDRG